MDSINITTASTTTTTTTTTTSASSTTTTAATTPTPTTSATSSAIKNVSLIVPPQDTSPTTISETPVTKRPKARPTPYSKPNPILLSSDRRTRKRKSLTWRPDDKLKEWHYFELIADERVNVVQKPGADQQTVANVAGGSSSNALNKLQPSSIGDKMSNASVDPLRRFNDGKTNEPNEPKLPIWRPLILIDFTPELPSPGWNSIERSAQAERETYVLGAIDLPGQPSTLDEPDQQQQQLKLNSTPSTNNGTSLTSSASSKGDSATGDGTSSIKIIPIDNPEGMTSEYHGLYESEIVNGVRIPSDDPQAAVQSMAPFCNQQSQLLTGQFQQQLAHSTQNPFAFQEMGTQFQQHTQMQLQFPFQQPQPQPMMPFNNQQQSIQIQQQQQQQAAAMPGPVTPWLNYPFNQVSENSHAHLFRRPAT